MGKVMSKRAIGWFCCLMGIAGAAPAVPEKLGVPEKSGVPANSAKPTVDPVEAAYDRGLRSLVAGDLLGAEQAFKESLKSQPNLAKAKLGLAEVAFKKNQNEQAAKLIREAVEAEPGNAHAQASLGHLLALQKKYPEAEVALKKAADLDPKMIRPRMDLADLYATVLRRPRDALILYQDVVAIDPDHAGAHYAWGMTEMRLGALAKARKPLENARRLQPSNPLPLLALARLSILQKDPDTAMTLLERALNIQPTLAEALELRGDVQQMRGNPDKALADYAAAIKLQPNRMPALMKQGSLLLQLGRKDEAGKVYQAAVRFDPREALAYNNLAWMAAESGKNLDQAEQWARKAVELGPDVAEFQDTLGWTYRARGKLKEAERALQRATGLQGASASAFYHLGVVEQALGKTHEATAAFRKALELDKNHEAAAQALRKLGVS